MQEKMKDSQEQLKLMIEELDMLALEKAELEARNKILKHVVRMNADCVDRLQSHKVNAYPSFEQSCALDLKISHESVPS